MTSNFDNDRYLKRSLALIQERALNTEGKLYLEINGKLLKDDFAAKIFTGYESENKKKLFSQLRDEAEILIAINAEYIIDKPNMTKEAIPFVEYVEFTLKKIENSVGIKPQLVITNINLENMYDLVFSFEKKFNTKGYKVWEKYAIKGFPINVDHILSEEGFWSDDHIPIFKKIAIITAIGEKSGSLELSLSQIYRDYEIWIPSSFALFQTLPLADLPVEHAINQAREQRKKTSELTIDQGGETIDLSDEESFKLLKNILGNYVDPKNLIKNYKKASDILICPTMECVNNISLAETLAQKFLSENR